MDEASRLFQIRRTVLQMLVDRGYIVGQSEIDMDKEAFKETYGETPARPGLVQFCLLNVWLTMILLKTLLLRKKDDPTDQLLVFWPEDPKVGVKPIKKYCERMKEEGVHRALIIVQQGMTSFAKQALVEMQPRFTVEYFQEAELLVGRLPH